MIRSTCRFSNSSYVAIITHDSELQGQGKSSKWHPDRLETYTHEYCTGTRALKIKNSITKELQMLASLYFR